LISDDHSKSFKSALFFISLPSIFHINSSNVPSQKFVLASFTLNVYFKSFIIDFVGTIFHFILFSCSFEIIKILSKLSFSFQSVIIFIHKITSSSKTILLVNIYHFNTSLDNASFITFVCFSSGKLVTSGI